MVANLGEENIRNFIIIMRHNRFDFLISDSLPEGAIKNIFDKCSDDLQ